MKHLRLSTAVTVVWLLVGILFLPQGWHHFTDRLVFTGWLLIALLILFVGPRIESRVRSKSK